MYIDVLHCNFANKFVSGERNSLILYIYHGAVEGISSIGVWSMYIFPLSKTNFISLPGIS